MKKLLIALLLLSITVCAGAATLSGWSGATIGRSTGNVGHWNGVKFGNLSTGRVAYLNGFRTYSSGTTVADHRYWRLLATDTSWTAFGSHAYFQGLYRISFYSTINSSGTDLALSKTAAASSFYGTGYEASKANDNNGATYWATANSAASDVANYWSVDLVTPATIRCVVLDTYSPSYTAKGYALQYSDDNVNWTTRNTISPASTAGAMLTFTAL